MDQKMNDGVEATLFGRPAMTAPAMAALALRFRCPVIPAMSSASARRASAWCASPRWRSRTPGTAEPTCWR